MRNDKWKKWMKKYTLGKEENKRNEGKGLGRT